MRFPTTGFFHKSVSPRPLSTPLGLFQIFRKLAVVFAAQGAPPVAKFRAGVVDPRGKFVTCVVDTGGKSLTCNILANF
jgi:hypothetical protein